MSKMQGVKVKKKPASKAKPKSSAAKKPKAGSDASKKAFYTKQRKDSMKSGGADSATSQKIEKKLAPKGGLGTPGYANKMNYAAKAMRKGTK
jgi:hypothetical protein